MSENANYCAGLFLGVSIGVVLGAWIASPSDQPRQIEAIEITKANHVNRNLSVEIKEGERVAFICEVAK